MLKTCDITIALSQRYENDITIRKNTKNGIDWIDTCLRTTLVAVSDQVRLFRIQSDKSVELLILPLFHRKA